jgi:hypothetical protein
MKLVYMEALVFFVKKYLNFRLEFMKQTVSHES